MPSAPRYIGKISPVFVDTIQDLRDFPVSNANKIPEYVSVRGYYAIGDGGGGPDRYWVSGAAPGTYVDNGGSIIVPSGGDGSRAWLFDVSRGVNVRDFGAKGDYTITDDTASIQAAIDAIDVSGVSGGGTVVFPPGKYRYTNLTTDQDVTNAIDLIGIGGATLVKTGSTGIGVLIRGKTGARRDGCSIRGLSFEQSVAQVSGSTIKILECDHTDLSMIDIESAYNPILVQDSFDTHIHNSVYLRNSVFCDILTTGTYVGASCIDTYISGVTGEGVLGNATKIGLLIDNGTSGLYVSDSDFIHGVHGVATMNSGTSSLIPEFLFFSQVLGDSTEGSAWNFPYPCKGLFLTSCWGATAKNSKHGFEFTAETGATLTNCVAIGNYGHGVRIAPSGGEIYIMWGIFSGNSLSAANTFDGIRVDGTVSNLMISDARCGNISGLGGGTQAYGISIQPGVADVLSITNCNLTGNGTGSLQDASTATNKRKQGNLGYNPVGYLAAAAVPASLTAYQNPFGIDCAVYIVGGIVTVIEVNVGTGWVATGVVAGHVQVSANAQIRITYTVAPTWTWFGN